MISLLTKTTPSSARKNNINTGKSVSDSDIQSNNNFATPADIFNQDNANELAQRPDICINQIIITPLPTLYAGSQIKTTR